jgi:hypothetical protein
MDSLINQTHTSSSLTVFHNYATYVAQQLPYIWLPADYYVEGVNSKLHNVAFNPFYTLLPEYWYFTTSGPARARGPPPRGGRRPALWPRAGGCEILS